LQKFADHLEMGTVTGILLHQIGKVGRSHIQPLRQKARDQASDCGLPVQERGRIVDFIDRGINGCPYRRSVRPVEQQRHLAGQCTGFGEHGDNTVAPDDFEPPLDEDKQPPGFGPLAKHEGAGRHLSPVSTRAIVQNLAHRPTPLFEVNPDG